MLISIIFAQEITFKKMPKEKYTNRSFLDLEEYENQNAKEVLAVVMKRRPEFIDRKRDKFYFSFKTKRDKDLFLHQMNLSMTALGYRTIVETEDDLYEVEKKAMRSQLVSSSSRRRKRIPV
jgi:hypothetical protein